mmetsp:Transcript_39295/g.123033  ORF Transcript_39295/g.123033 Transcript_39295/m.123033 type:complete len:248 (-) Transcript_39295:288-1031(-)
MAMSPSAPALLPSAPSAASPPGFLLLSSKTKPPCASQRSKKVPSAEWRRCLIMSRWSSGGRLRTTMRSSMVIIVVERLPMISPTSASISSVESRRFTSGMAPFSSLSRCSFRFSTIAAAVRPRHRTRSPHSGELCPPKRRSDLSIPSISLNMRRSSLCSSSYSASSTSGSGASGSSLSCSTLAPLARSAGQITSSSALECARNTAQSRLNCDMMCSTCDPHSASRHSARADTDASRLRSSPRSARCK